MLTVATYFWIDPASKHKFHYSPDDVRRLKTNIAKHLTTQHEFAVITDRGQLFEGDDDIRPIPLDMTTHVPGTCFCRLHTFDRMGAEIFGQRMLVVDLDTLIVGNIDQIVNRDEDLVMWHNPSRIPWDKPEQIGRPYYNTSILLHRCGMMPWLKMDFDPHKPGWRDDQWYLSHRLGQDMPYWDGKDGIYRLGREDTPGSGVMGKLPKNARIVTFPGSEGKWFEPHIRHANPWIQEHLHV